MNPMVPQFTGVSIVYSTDSSGTDQRKYQSSASLTFVRGILRWLVNSTHKGLVTRKSFHLMTYSWGVARGGGGIYIHLLFCLFYTSLKIYDDTCSELEAFYIMYLFYDTTLIGDYLACTPWTTLSNKRNTFVKHPDTVAAGRPQIWVKIRVHHM